MTSTQIAQWVKIFVGAVMVNACVATGGASRAVPMDVVYSNSHCRGTSAASVTRIKEAAELDKLTGNALGTGLGMTTGARIEFPAPDRAWLLGIDMGERRNAGYALALQRAELAGDVLTLYTDWQEPPPDALTAQVMTHPCVVVRVPPLDPTLKKIRVIDQAGRVRIEEDLAR